MSKEEEVVAPPADEQTEEKPKPKQVPRADRKAVEKAAAALTADIEKINEEIAAYDKQIEDIKKQIEAANDARSGQQDEFTKERAKRDEIKAELDKVKIDRDALSADFERLKGKVDNAIETSKSQKAQMKFRTVEEIDTEINRLERLQSTTSMKLAEEKKVVKEIETLRGQKRQLAALGQSSDQIAKDRDERTRIGNELKAKRDEFNEILTRLNAQRELMDQMNNKDEKKGKIASLIEERKALSEKKKEAVGRIREVQKQIKEKWEEFKQQKKDWEAWMDEERKVRDGERKARQEEYQRKLEEEEMKKVPYEEEMALCDYLVNYLKVTFLSEEGQAGAAASKSAAGASSSSFELDGKVLQAYKRDDEEEEWAAAHSKKKGGAGGKKKAKKDTIVHSPDTLASFAIVELEAPKSVAAVSKAIEELNEKKAWYKVQPRPPRKAAEVKEEGETKPEKSKKTKQAKEFKKVDEEFPELGGPKPSANGNGAVAAAPATEA